MRKGREIKPAVALAAVLIAAVAVAFVVLSTRSKATEASSSIPGVPDHPDYNWDVLPIISQNCFLCHGPDGTDRKADLRLDDPRSAFGELPTDPGKYAIVPGKPERSEMVRRITSPDPEYRMPAKGSHLFLTPQQIAILTRWIAQGAKYEKYWAFAPPVARRPPETTYDARAVNDIDRFVFARMEMAGLAPQPEADKETLIRRVTFTLTGLPPAPADIDAFNKDTSSNAYEKVVDRLLASPAYGERMAAYWMNEARWAETDGYLDDHTDRFLWPYRDWVISAFNQNMPYDQFATWQLAGDLLPHPTRAQLVATAFGRMGKRSTENGIIDAEYQTEYGLERTTTFGMDFLALTVGCARCHDHKYDPVSQKDFYSLSGFFNQVDEPGFYPPGAGGVTAGPAISWTDHATDVKIAAANAQIQAREAGYEAAQRTAAADLAPQVDALLQKPADAIGAAIRDSLDKAMVGFYPFETTEPIPPAKFPTAEPPAPTPIALVNPVTYPLRFAAAKPPSAPGGKPTKKAAAYAPGKMPSAGTAAKKGPAKPKGRVGPGGKPLPKGDWVPAEMVFSPNLAAPDSPAVLQRAILKKGHQGNALWFDDTNMGYLMNDVGTYERTHGFSIDLWFYLDHVYQDSTIINDREDDNSGGRGYQLNVENNILHFDLIHSWPYNMLSIATKKPMPTQRWIHVAVTYDGSSRVDGLKMYLNGEPADVNAVRNNLTLTALPAHGGDVFNPTDGFAFGKRFKPQTLTGGAIDELRVFNRALTPVEVAYLDKGNGAPAAQSGTLRQGLTAMEVANSPSVVQAEQLLTAARDQENKIASDVPQVMVMGDRPIVTPTYDLPHGVYDSPGDQVQVRALNAVLPWNNDWPRNRLGLSMWLFDRRNPLTARVFVNRLWQISFGKGIVRTPEDFGIQGTIPTHPELLDWLAVQFMDSNWDIKKMEKLMVMSAVFRESSEVAPGLARKDPENLLYARGERLRLPAEMVRDNALAASGELIGKIGGPSVFPYEPAGLWKEIGAFEPYPSPDQVPAEDQHRRSLYTFIKRNEPPPAMTIFDQNDRSASSVTQTVSNSPLQALIFFDDPQYVEAYRNMAVRALKGSPDRDQQIAMVYRLATEQQPTGAETSVLRTLYDEEAVRFARSPQDVEGFLRVGVTPVDPRLDPVQLAALTTVAAAVMATPDAYTMH